MYSNEKILQTERLTLKSITPATIRELFTRYNEHEISEMLGLSREGYRRYHTMFEKGMETDRITFYFFLLINKHNHEPIGECGFHTWNTFHQRAELFYLLRQEEDKQKGYMTEALQVVIPFGFETLQLHRIEAFVADWNTPSVKLLQKFNFTKEGTAREHYLSNGVFEDSDVYSLLQKEHRTTEKSG